MVFNKLKGGHLFVFNKNIVELSAVKSKRYPDSELLLKHTGTVQQHSIVFQLCLYFKKLLISTTKVLLLLTTSCMSSY